MRSVSWASGNTGTCPRGNKCSDTPALLIQLHMVEPPVCIFYGFVGVNQDPRGHVKWCRGVASLLLAAQVKVLEVDHAAWLASLLRNHNHLGTPLLVASPAGTGRITPLQTSSSSCRLASASQYLGTEAGVWQAQGTASGDRWM